MGKKINLFPIITMVDAKANIEGDSAVIKETPLAYSTDTAELGIYIDGDWNWLSGGGGASSSDLIEHGHTGSTDGGLLAFVGARYNSNAAQTIVNNATIAIVDFEDQVYDSGSLVTTGAAWKFTAPSTGYYHIDVYLLFAANTGWAVGERGLLHLYKNNAVFVALDRKDDIGNAASGSQLALHGSVTIALAATDYIDVRVAQNSGGNIALSNAATDVWINIEKVG